MYVVHHAHLKSHCADGETCQTVADASLGVRHFEVCLRRLEPGAHGAPLQHDGELVVLVLAGCGKLLIDGGPQRISAPCTVLVPPRHCAQFVNDGSEALELVAVGSRRPDAG